MVLCECAFVFILRLYSKILSIHKTILERDDSVEILHHIHNNNYGNIHNIIIISFYNVNTLHVYVLKLKLPLYHNNKKCIPK